MDCLVSPMTLVLAKVIVAMYWASFCYIGFVFAIGYYFERIKNNEKYTEGLIAAMICRTSLKFIAIFGYANVRTDIAITGFVMIAWIGLNLKRKLDKITTNNYYNW